MKNITLALDENTLEAGRAYAQRHDTTLNALVRELLVKTVVADREAAVREMFRLMDAHPGRAPRKRWTREEPRSERCRSVRAGSRCSVRRSRL
jgi:hypothetical protein